MFQKGLKGIVAVQTRIGSVDGELGELKYRGERIEDLVNGRSFEEMAFYLWNGRFPAGKEYAELLDAFAQHRILPDHVEQVAASLPDDTPLMDGLRTLVSAWSSESFNRKPPSEQALLLTAALPTAIALLYRKKHELDPIGPRPDFGHTANFLWMVSGRKPPAAHTDALESYLKLTMEHGMNASTFAARVTISTESDLVSAITSALGTMKGPLHGGAPSGVIDLLEEIHSPECIRPVVLEKLGHGEKIMGFGHRIYRTEDPRSVLLRERFRKLAGEDEWLDLAVQAEQEIVQILADYKPGRALYTNVEFYAAAVMRAISLPPALFTPVFSTARIVGWTAHAIEQLADNVIFRPESEYIGQ
ncbi:citrate synthase/methylcitrate synthase [Indiicoccus explosivorum]|uniref:citrate synthase/methylcitrate synthase n=1 Tax=Indiicoccus explosivorum TaxID=1917864 RepID=UPI000B440B94|nr:citrate synthase/methylcitrate synthase [Indiicoccus explosivorum]